MKAFAGSQRASTGPSYPWLSPVAGRPAGGQASKRADKTQRTDRGNSRCPPSAVSLAKPVTSQNLTSSLSSRQFRLQMQGKYFGKQSKRGIIIGILFGGRWMKGSDRGLVDGNKCATGTQIALVIFGMNLRPPGTIPDTLES